MPLSILVIGGGVFIGRHLVEEAVRRGHHVTVVRRGLSSSAPSPAGVTTVCRDRSDGFGELSGRPWDVVVDTCGYLPSQVRRSAVELDCGTYVLISSVSVYRDFAAPTGVTAAVLPAAPDGPLDGGSYGVLKSGCEQALAQARATDRNLVVRAGLVVGPHDLSSRARYGRQPEAPTHLHYDRFSGRFPYWPWRFMRGGTIAAPGHPDAPLQLLDVRDLAEWLLRLLESGTAGTFNAVGPQTSWGELIEACAAASVVAGAHRSAARVRWVPDDILVAEQVPAYTGLPLWAPATRENRWFHRVPEGTHKAWRRSPTETVRAVAEWLARDDLDPRRFLGGHELTPQGERRLLARLGSSRAEVAP